MPNTVQALRECDPVESSPKKKARHSVTVGMPAYNEQAILESTVKTLLNYLPAIEADFDYEILIVNDGSSDETHRIADRVAAEHACVRVIHHPYNRGLCQALKTIFANTRTDYLVTLDMDLSYSPDHIKTLLDEIMASQAKVVLASPYMEGGKVENVPWLRREMSRWANYFLKHMSPEPIKTYTGMVRAYNTEFIQSLDLKAWGMDVNPEILYKALLLRERVSEVPATLAWRHEEDIAALERTAAPSQQETEDEGPKRHSSMQLPWHTLGIVMSGFIFRPYLFFFVPAFLMLIPCIVFLLGLLYHVFVNPIPKVQAVHLSVISGTFGILFFGLVCVGIISMQAKRYFEELYHLATSIYNQKPPPKEQP
ncbi:MAG: glycosyltransferase family 2 protein [Verrucomicrobiota bacterium]